MRRVLILRPEPAAGITAEKARQLWLDPLAVPLFEVQPIAWQAPDPTRFDALLLTSANAVRLSGERLGGLRGLPVYAVGEATAEAARNAGLEIAAAGDAGVEQLLGSIEAALRLLHLCGADCHAAQNARQKIAAIPVYRSHALAAPDLSEIGGSVALIHSPRAARRFAELVSERADIAIAAISQAAAEAVGAGWECVEATERPSDDALLALAARLCNKPATQ